MTDANLRAGFCLAALAATLVACGGGGSSPPLRVSPTSSPTASATASVAPSVAATATPSGTPTFSASPPAGFAVVQITLSDSTTDTSTARRPEFLSTSTNSFTVTVGSQTTVAACAARSGTSCYTELDAPVGSDAFTIVTYDQAGGAGNALSRTTVTATITAGEVNSVNVSPEAIVASATLAASPGPLTGGTAGTAQLSLAAYDADGNAITGSAPYANSITVTNGDTSGASSLSAAAFTAPGQTITFTYSGNSAAAPITISAAGSGVSSIASLIVVSRTPATVTYFPLPAPSPSGAVAAYPLTITVGPDGNLWIAGQVCPASHAQCSGYLDQMTTAGTGTASYAFPLAAYPTVGRLTTGPDGALWILNTTYPATLDGYVDRVTTSGVASAYPTPPAEGVAGLGGTLTPGAIITGPDGNLWATGDGLFRILPNGTITEIDILPVGQTSSGIVAGPDGNIWTIIAGSSGYTIVRVNPSTGALTSVAATASSGSMVVGSDGNIWFLEAGGIGKITTGGTVTTYSISGIDPEADLVSGPDGDIYTRQVNTQQPTQPDSIIQINTAGQVTQTYALTVQVASLCVGPDGALWFVPSQTSTPAPVGRLAP
ncbi:MAG TPA: hypothetical protein VME66_14200 [Candidatus Acidoferrales bacterium]|nr:hypothetical protein [Candidatus Acidoferrales bacterium]